MVFKLFNVDTTNIYPMTNSKMGGQLLTEYNVTAKESVLTAPSVAYKIGQSYVHSENDFRVSVMSGSVPYFPNSVSVTDTALQISKGRAVVNGYYVESLVDIVIDLNNITYENTLSGDEEAEILSGELAIGLKTYFSDTGQLSGSLLIEEEQESGATVYAGVQIVILPKNQFITPTTILNKGMSNEINYGASEYEGSSTITADILLATFNYTNGNISNIVLNPERMQCIPAERIAAIDNVMEDVYVRKTGLNPDRLYTFSGKGIDPATGYDTWCDSTDSLMIWDNNPQKTTTEPTDLQATFKTNAYGNGINLVIPHKQVDGMVNSQGTRQYYQSVALPVPTADFAMGTPGMVNSEYTQYVKDAISKLNTYYRLPNGQMKMYIESLTDRADLPTISQQDSGAVVTGEWEAGDYVLVSRDSTVLAGINDTLNLTPPSTLYIVIPPTVTAITKVTGSTRPSGAELGVKYLDEKADNIDYDPSTVTTWWGDLAQYHGETYEDYFTLTYTSYNSQGTAQTVNYYFVVTGNTGLRVYSDPVLLTGQLPYASEELVGGFLNVSTSNTDAGYVYMDENGHLRLLDYGLLRTGVLAYQLGADFTVPSGLTLDEIQSYLDDYVNNRVAFPNSEQFSSASTSGADAYVININISLPKNDTEATLLINNIDSRFGASVCINISGDADSNTIVNIMNCEKVRITTTNTIDGPKINLVNSCLYYDASIISILNYISDMTLWYQAYTEDDPKLMVENMKVSALLDSTGSLVVDDIDYWTPESPNDNHMQVALQSITFATNGMIYGCELLVKNATTANVQMGESIVLDSFTFSSPSYLPFPTNRLTSKMYVTGQFITAYSTISPLGYVVIDTKFTVQTSTDTEPGEIAVVMNAHNIEKDNRDSEGNQKVIGAWSPDIFHVFSSEVVAKQSD